MDKFDPRSAGNIWMQIWGPPWRDWVQVTLAVQLRTALAASVTFWVSGEVLTLVARSAYARLPEAEEAE